MNKNSIQNCNNSGVFQWCCSQVFLHLNASQILDSDQIYYHTAYRVSLDPGLE